MSSTKQSTNYAFSTSLPMHGKSKLIPNTTTTGPVSNDFEKTGRRIKSTTRATLAKPMPVTRTKRINTSTSTSIHTLSNENELKSNLKHTNDHEITVIKCHASYCAGCRGVAPKYKKIAAAYNDTDAPVSFYEMDYVKNEQFCKTHLGVNNLPFFAVFKGDQLISAKSIGWKSISRSLVDTIDHAIDQN